MTTAATKPVRAKAGHGMVLQKGAVRIDVLEFFKKTNNDFRRWNQLVWADDFKIADQFPCQQEQEEADERNPVFFGCCSKIIGLFYFKAQGHIALLFVEGRLHLYSFSPGGRPLRATSGPVTPAVYIRVSRLRSGYFAARS